MTAATVVGSGRRRGLTPAAVVGACAAIAALSLALPAALTFDAHAWLVWGREVMRLSLDTTGGPSWKPLPVLVTAAVAPLGSGAATAWMIFARTATLLAVAGTYRLAARIGGSAAGVVAAVVLVLSPDGDPRFLRLLGEGHVAGLTAACAVWAIDRHLESRHRAALVLAFTASLVRPEAWPFLVIYAAWLWRRDRGWRSVVILLLTLVPVLWFGGDWLGSGSPVEGAATAQVGARTAVATRFVDAAAVLVGVVTPAAWVAAMWGWKVTAGERWPRLAAAGAVGWALLVTTMATAFGYAALSRFHLPVAAVAAVLAGIGAVRAWRRMIEARATLLAVVVTAAALATLTPRVIGLPGLLAGVAERAPVEEDLDRVLAAVGRDRLLACDTIAVETAGLLRMAVAWKLDLPVGAVPTALDSDPPRGTMLVRTGSARHHAIARQDHTEMLLRSKEWSALAVNCS